MTLTGNLSANSGTPFALILPSKLAGSYSEATLPKDRKKKSNVRMRRKANQDDLHE